MGWTGQFPYRNVHHVTEQSVYSIKWFHENKVRLIEWPEHKNLATFQCLVLLC